MEENKDIQALTDQVKDLGNTVKDAVEKAEKNISASVEEKLTAKADAEEVKSLKEEIKQLKAANGTRMVNGGEAKGFDEQLREAIEKGAKAYAAKGEEKGGFLEIQLKTAITSANFTHDTTNNTRVYAEQREAGINKPQKREPFVRQLAFNGTASSDTISWTEKVSESGNPIPLAELDSYPEETTSYQQFSTTVKKIGGMTKVSEEKLSDVEWMMNEIQQELVQRHDLVVDTQILSGAGTGQNLKGVLTYATAFAAGDFALAVPDANHYDVLAVAVLQVQNNLFQPSAIVMHPTDIKKMRLKKDANNNYVAQLWIAGGSQEVESVPVIANTGMTKGDFLVGDFSRLGVFAKGGAVLEIGRDGNDFSTDQVTVKLRERLAVRIKGQDLGAFVKGTFSTAITAIKTA